MDSGLFDLTARTHAAQVSPAGPASGPGEPTLSRPPARRGGPPPAPDPLWSDHSRLGEVKTYVLQARTRRQGVKCPCCGAISRVYRRALSATMLRHLIDMYKHAAAGAGRWFVVGERGYGTGDAAKLLYWGLAKKHPDRDRTYAITQLGIDFVEGRVAVASHVLLYRGACIGRELATVTFGKAISKKFELFGQLGVGQLGAIAGAARAAQESQQG